MTSSVSNLIVESEFSQLIQSKLNFKRDMRTETAKWPRRDARFADSSGRILEGGIATSASASASGSITFSRFRFRFHFRFCSGNCVNWPSSAKLPK